MVVVAADDSVIVNGPCACVSHSRREFMPNAFDDDDDDNMNFVMNFNKVCHRDGSFNRNFLQTGHCECVCVCVT